MSELQEKDLAEYTPDEIMLAASVVGALAVATILDVKNNLGDEKNRARAERFNAYLETSQSLHMLAKGLEVPYVSKD